MSDKFKKLMIEQLQNSLHDFTKLAHKPVPQKGWIRAVREALSMSSESLANRLGCQRSNITAIEQREVKKTISLETLETVAKALNCTLVYCIIPNEPFDKIIDKQARIVAQKKVQKINNSMKLEQQGLDPKQLKQKEDILVQELLRGNLKKLWNDDEVNNPHDNDDDDYEI